MKENNEATSPKSDAGQKRAYHKPELKVFGALRTVTLSPTPDPDTESGPGVGYAESVPVDAFDPGWSRNDVESGGGRGRRG